jgi:predicted nucleotidyltransferase
MNRIMAIPIMRELYERRLLSNAIVAGGSISAILTRGRMFEDSDIDIFIYGDNKERTIRDIMHVIDRVYGNYTLSVGGSVMYVMPTSPSEDRRMIQIVSS